MNYFNRYDEIRRLIDRATGLPDPARILLAQEVQRQAQLAATMSLPLAVLAEVNRVQAEAGSRLRLLDTLSVSSVLAEVNRVRAQVESQLNLLDARSAPSVLGDLDRTRREIESQLHRLETRSTMLEVAMSPLPDVSRFTPRTSFLSIENAAQRLNASFLSARVLGQFDFEGSIDSGETAADTDPEEDLVELVPAEVLADLQRVDFAPIVLLDRVLRNPAILHQISARDFEGFVATLIEELGFEDVVLTRRSADGGRDVLAKRRLSGSTILFAFECKRNSPNRPVGVAIARALLGTITHPATRVDRGVLVTTSRFTAPARQYILTAPSLDGKDFDDVIGWLHEYATKRQQRDRR